jgi:hypothetical protein
VWVSRARRSARHQGARNLGSARVARLLAFSLLAAVVITGCPGEPALDEQVPITLSILTPELEGEIVFSEVDGSALDLERRRWDIELGPDYGATNVPTGLTQSDSQSTEYCFSGPVMLASPSGQERPLIQPGECFGGSWTTMDREGVRFNSPARGAVVGDQLEVQVDVEAGTSESTVEFFVDGAPSTRGTSFEGRATLDLSDVAPGPVAIRVEVVEPSGRASAASVIEVVKAEPGE